MSVVVSTVAAALAALVIFSYLTSETDATDSYAGPNPADADRLLVGTDPTGVSPILPVGLNK